MKGHRRIEFYIPIELHERIKGVSAEKNNVALGKVANHLLARGLDDYDRQKAIETTAVDASKATEEKGD